MLHAKEWKCTLLVTLRTTSWRCHYPALPPTSSCNTLCVRCYQQLVHHRQNWHAHSFTSREKLTSVSYRGWGSWDFPPLTSSFPPQGLLTSAIYSYYYPTSRASCPLPCHLKNHESVWNTAYQSTMHTCTFISCPKLWHVILQGVGLASLVPTPFIWKGSSANSQRMPTW